MLKINGNIIKTPSVFEVQISDIDGESHRNSRGEIIRDRIAVKRKLTLEWLDLTDSEISKILKSISATFFTVNYPDPVEGKLITKTFYVGDRTAPLYNYKFKKWQNLKANFVEK